MFSLRILSRSVPRTFARSISCSARPASALCPAFKTNFLQSSWKQIAKPCYPAFSTTSIRKGSGDSDAELVAKLGDELKFEKESGLQHLEDSVQNIQYILQNNSWEVNDVPGEQEVVMTKKFGKEEIRVTFTVADLQNLSEEEDYDDLALNESAEPHQPINQSPTPSGTVPQHSEDRVAPADRDADEHDADFERGFPARVNVSIEKEGQGALLIQAVADEGIFQIEEVSYFNQPDLAHAQTAEKDWARQSLYAGPPFGNLDVDLQSFFEQYLEERGVNAELANMLPDYIKVKEQREYVRWLESVKNFVAA